MPTLRPVPRAATLRHAQLTRRTLLRGAGATGMAALLAACGTEGTTVQDEADKQAVDKSDTEKELNFSNWIQYIDEGKGNSRPTLDRFEKQTGIQVNYTDDINDNNSFFGKIRPQLASGQSIDRDLMVLTDWMAARLIRLGWVQKIDKANVPNMSNLTPALASPGWDENRDYSLPWQSGLTGIGYNAKATGKEIRSIDQLLTDPDLKGKVTMLTEMRDTMGLILLAMGKDPENFTDDDFMAGIDALQRAVDSGQIRRFTGNEYSEGLARGTIAACVAWSGDVIQLKFEDPQIQFVAPETGLMLWSDNMLIPNKAEHKKNAETLMNYYYDPEVAAELAAWVNYICPVQGAQEAMKDIDPELADNPLIFPDEETLAQTHDFRGLTEEEERRYDDAFAQVTGA